MSSAIPSYYERKPVTCLVSVSCSAAQVLGLMKCTIPPILRNRPIDDFRLLSVSMTNSTGSTALAFRTLGGFLVCLAENVRSGSIQSLNGGHNEAGVLGLFSLHNIIQADAATVVGHHVAIDRHVNAHLALQNSPNRNDIFFYLARPDNEAVVLALGSGTLNFMFSITATI